MGTAVLVNRCQQQIIAPALAERRRNYGGQTYGLREALGRYGA